MVVIFLVLLLFVPCSYHLVTNLIKKRPLHLKKNIVFNLSLFWFIKVESWTTAVIQALIFLKWFILSNKLKLQFHLDEISRLIFCLNLKVIWTKEFFINNHFLKLTLTAPFLHEFWIFQLDVIAIFCLYRHWRLFHLRHSHFYGRRKSEYVYTCLLKNWHQAIWCSVFWNETKSNITIQP